MKTKNSEENNKSSTPNMDRQTPDEVRSPMPKPKKSDKDNDFTKGDDQNDPANKKKIERPEHESIHEEDEDDTNRIKEPVADDDDRTDVLHENENEVHSQDYKRNLK